VPTPRDDLRFSNTTGILQKKTMWFIGVEVEQETSAPPPKKNPGSAPALERTRSCHAVLFFSLLAMCSTSGSTLPRANLSSKIFLRFSLIG